MKMFEQGTQRIEVVVRKESGSSLTGANEKSSDSSPNGEDNRGRQARSEAKQKRILLTNATHSIAFAKQQAHMWVNYALTGVGIKYGDQALQDSFQRQLEVVEDGTNLASSIAMGAIYGAWGGPLGVAMGVAISGLTTASSIGMKYMQREREFNYKQFKENNSIEYRRARASINLTTGRLR